MSNISAFGNRAPAVATSISATTYSPLDTNEDGVVSATELAAALAPAADTDATSADLPTSSAADTLSDEVASAMIDVQTLDTGEKPTSSIEDALSAYLGAETA